MPDPVTLVQPDEHVLRSSGRRSFLEACDSLGTLESITIVVTSTDGKYALRTLHMSGDKEIDVLGRASAMIERRRQELLTG